MDVGLFPTTAGLDPLLRALEIRSPRCCEALFFPVALEAIEATINLDLSRCVGFWLPTPLQRRPVSQRASELDHAEPEGMHP